MATPFKTLQQQIREAENSVSDQLYEMERGVPRDAPGPQPLNVNYSTLGKGDFQRGVQQGVENLRGTAQGLRALYNAATGDEQGALEAGRVAQRHFQYGSQIGPQINRTGDVDSFGDFVDYTQGLLGTVTPDLAAMAAGGGLFGATAKGVLGALAKRSARTAAKAEAASAGSRAALPSPPRLSLPGVAQLPAVRQTALSTQLAQPASNLASRKAARRAGSAMTPAGRAAAAGGYLTNVGIQAGRNQQSMMEDDQLAVSNMSLQRQAATVLGGSAVSAGIDFLPILRVANKFGGGGLVSEIKSELQDGLKNTVAKLGTEAGKQFALESGTEGVQTVIERTISKAIDNNREIFGEEGMQEIFEAMVAGGVVGGVMGGGASGLNMAISKMQQSAESMSARDFSKVAEQFEAYRQHVAGKARERKQSVNSFFDDTDFEEDTGTAGMPAPIDGGPGPDKPSGGKGRTFDVDDFEVVLSETRGNESFYNIPREDLPQWVQDYLETKQQITPESPTSEVDSYERNYRNVGNGDFFFYPEPELRNSVNRKYNLSDAFSDRWMADETDPEVRRGTHEWVRLSDFVETNETQQLINKFKPGGENKRMIDLFAEMISPQDPQGWIDQAVKRNYERIVSYSPDGRVNNARTLYNKARSRIKTNIDREYEALANYKDDPIGLYDYGVDQAVEHWRQIYRDLKKIDTSQLNPAQKRKIELRLNNTEAAGKRAKALKNLSPERKRKVVEQFSQALRADDVAVMDISKDDIPTRGFLSNARALKEAEGAFSAAKKKRDDLAAKKRRTRAPTIEELGGTEGILGMLRVKVPSREQMDAMGPVDNTVNITDDQMTKGKYPVIEEGRQPDVKNDVHEGMFTYFDPETREPTGINARSLTKFSMPAFMNNTADTQLPLPEYVGRAFLAGLASLSLDYDIHIDPFKDIPGPTVIHNSGLTFGEAYNAVLASRGSTENNVRTYLRQKKNQIKNKFAELNAIETTYETDLRRAGLENEALVSSIIKEERQRVMDEIDQLQNEIAGMEDMLGRDPTLEADVRFGDEVATDQVGEREGDMMATFDKPEPTSRVYTGEGTVPNEMPEDRNRIHTSKEDPEIDTEVVEGVQQRRQDRMRRQQESRVEEDQFTDAETRTEEENYWHRRNQRRRTNAEQRAETAARQQESGEDQTFTEAQEAGSVGDQVKTHAADEDRYGHNLSGYKNKDAQLQSQEFRDGFKRIADTVLKKLGITDYDVLILDTSELYNYYSGIPGGGVELAIALDNGRLGTTLVGDKISAIWVNPFLSKESQYATFGHELGHVIFRQMFDQAPSAVQRKLINGWRDWVKKARGINYYEYLIDHNGNPLEIDEAKADALFRGDDEFQAYSHSFEEYMAERIGEWMIIDRRPQTDVEQHISKYANQIQDFFGLIRGWLGASSVNEWLNQMWDANLPPTSMVSVQRFNEQVEQRDPHYWEYQDSDGNWRAVDEDTVGTGGGSGGGRDGGGGGGRSGGDFNDGSAGRDDIRASGYMASSDPRLQLLGFMDMFDRLFSDREKRTLLEAADSYYIRRQLEEALKNNPAALKFAMSDPKARVAFMYLLNKEGMLDTGKRSQSLLLRAVKRVAQVLGIVSKSDQAVSIFNWMDNANALVINAKLQDPSMIVGLPPQLRENKLQRISAEIRRGVETAAKPMAKLLAPTSMRWANNPYLKQLRDIAYRDFTRANQEATYTETRDQWSSKLSTEAFKAISQAILKDPRKTEALLKYLQNREIPTDPEIRAAKERIDTFFKTAHAYAKSRGLNLKYVKDYFPLSFDAALVADYRYEVAAILARYVPEDQIPPNVSKDQFVENILDNIVDQDGVSAMEFGAHDRFQDPFMSAMLTRDLKWLTDNPAAMTELSRYMNNDLMDIMGTYIHQLVTRAEYSNHYGQNGARIEELIQQARQNGATNDEIIEALDFLDGTLGIRSQEFVRKHPKLNAAIRVMSVYQAIRTLPLALFAQLGDVGGMFIRGDGRAVLKSMMDGFKGIDLDLAEEMGIVQDDLADAIIAQGFDTAGAHGWSRKVADAYFKMNGMQWWTKTSRVIGTSLATRMFYKWKQDPEAHARDFAEIGIDPADLEFYTSNGRHYVKRLPTSLFMQYMRDLQDPSTSDSRRDELARILNKEERINQAYNRFVNSAVLRPDAMSRPNWANDPMYHLFFQLKGFMYKFWDVYHRKVFYDIAYEGKYRGAAAMMTMVPLFLAGEMMRDLVQHLGDDDPRKEKWSSWDHIANATERSGILGPFEFITNLRDDMKYNNLPFESNYGPAAEQGLDWMRVAFGNKRADSELARAVPASPLLIPQYRALFED